MAAAAMLYYAILYFFTADYCGKRRDNRKIVADIFNSYWVLIAKSLFVLKISKLLL